MAGVTRNLGNLLAWTDYTPVLTAVTTNPTIGTGGYQLGRYMKIGRMVIGKTKVQFGSAGSNAGSGIYSISMPPVAARSPATGEAGMVGQGYCFSASAFVPILVLQATTSTFGLYYSATFNGATTQVAHNLPFAWSASQSIDIHFFYEAAS